MLKNNGFMVMRCTRIILDVFQRHLFWRQCFVLVFAGSVSFTANATIVANSTRATHLIQAYLQSKPVHRDMVEHTQTKVNQTLDRLSQLSSQQIATMINKIQLEKTNGSWIYPVRSTHLSPGHVTLRRIQIALPQPIFIVGDDPLSKVWLHHYADRLAHIYAKGFVVNVNSRKAMQKLNNDFPQLSLLPMPGDALATWLRLTHYPVLISDTRIEQ